LELPSLWKRFVSETNWEDEMKPKLRKVLVVEDDYLQAQEIAYFVRGAGAEVLGPAATLERGLHLAPQADSAVLDIDLNGQTVFPLADMLMVRNVPIVFYSGATREVIVPERFWHVPMVKKPVQTLSEAAIVTFATYSDGAADDDLTIILPKLRLAARLIYTDPIVADRLVERLLQDAIDQVKSGKDLANGDARSRWLMERMRQIVKHRGHDLMN
jgi:DNA-binding LytR/AlgR family response regulator